MITLCDKERKSRKRYKCDSCLRKIEKGELYSYQFNVERGRAWHYRSHLDCNEAVRAVINYLHPYDYEDGLPNVHDFESEDWETVKQDAPEAYHGLVSMGVAPK